MRAKSKRALALLVGGIALTALCSPLRQPVFAQGGAPPSISGWECSDISVAEQCNNENEVQNCPPQGGSGELCSYCEAPNPNALVLRCLFTGDKNDACVKHQSEPDSVACGRKYTGTCDGQGGCEFALPGIQCSNIKPKRCN